MMRRLTLVLVALVIAVGPAAARPDAARADNSAVAINTKDGSSIFKFAFAIKRVAGDVVDQTNAAVAYASCTQCQTIAIAIEIVLVTGDPSVVTPTNLALAINDQCTLCVTVADAYQFVVSAPADFSFSPHGMQEIRRIVEEIRKLGKGDLTAAEIQARLEELVKELRAVLVDELANAGKDQGGGDGRGPPAQTTTEPATTGGESTTTSPETSTTTETTTTTEPATTEATTTDSTSTTTTP
jgi:putative peptide zinc metalloprotease protein